MRTFYTSSSRAVDGPDAPPRPLRLALAPAPLRSRAGRLARVTMVMARLWTWNFTSTTGLDRGKMPGRRDTGLASSQVKEARLYTSG
ncbi:MAG: hypothetical protein LC808_07890, partial [Actinobacteria bacterium]|nr:hypothetical protein [Actinomycetota bacterium]